uniref:Ig-like domain-containing protein n=1 Tax=Plectus sambesii TaxID=2011161 RepID=A0A914UHT9_9BILA
MGRRLSQIGNDCMVITYMMDIFSRMLLLIYFTQLSCIVGAVEDFGKPPYLAAGFANIEIEPPCAKFISSDPLYATKPVTLWCAPKEFKGDTEYLPFDRVRWSKYPSDNSSVVEAVEVTDEYPSKISILNSRNATLELGYARASAIGKYRCDLWNEDEYIATGNLFVNMRPVIEQEAGKMLRLNNDDKFSLTADEDPEAAMEDSTVNFTCNVIGYPEPIIRWEKNNKSIENDGKHFNITENTLTILRVASDDAATFKCIATNTFFSPSHQENVTFDTTVSFTLKVDSQRTLLPFICIVIIIIILIILIALAERRRKGGSEITRQTQENRPKTLVTTKKQPSETAVFV